MRGGSDLVILSGAKDGMAVRRSEMTSTANTWPRGGPGTVLIQARVGIAVLLLIDIFEVDTLLASMMEANKYPGLP